MSELLTIREASNWATNYLQKNVSTSNIAYLIQYGRVKKVADNGVTFVDKTDLVSYYQLSYNSKREIEWKTRLGNDLNWSLAFDGYKEAETTKHVHRLHPYKGKFIPQLVEYFMDSHTDNFKQDVYFYPGDIVLDPFCGSGTTLIQGNELGIHAVGIDISSFNSLIGNVKVHKHNIVDIQQEIHRITSVLKKFLGNGKTREFDKVLLDELNKFNYTYFPVPEYKYRVRRGEINQHEYGHKKAQEFFPTYSRLVNEYKIKLTQQNASTFLDKWYIPPIKSEIQAVFNEIKQIKNTDTKKVISVILSRTMRSCRATSHADLATLKDPVTTTYYCAKHGKICKPLFSILKWWESYSQDTLERLVHFDRLRTDTYQHCLIGDSRSINIFQELEKRNHDFGTFARKQKIRGIFSSPPYVGLIDYHEQHAYAYDLFGFARKDELEIGPLYKGKGKKAQESYVQGISAVLNNCKKFMVANYDVFLVANDRSNLYPTIAEKAGMKIVNQYKRPVLNRTEKDKTAYAEIIFHLKKK